MLKKISKHIDKFCLALGFWCAVVPFPWYISAAVMNETKLDHSKKYAQVFEAEVDVEKEKKKLGLDGVIIKIIFSDSHHSAYADVLKDGNGYLLCFGKSRDRDTLQHEMFHIYEMYSGVLDESKLARVFHHFINPLNHPLAELRASDYAITAPND